MKLLLLLTAFVSCTHRSGAQNLLPATRPADITINYNVDGGMRYYNEHLSICKDSCSFTKNDGGRRSVVRFKLSPVEMDVLYEKFLSNKFDKIETDEMNVNDRGGISIDVNWNRSRNAIRVSDAQMTFVKESSRKNWSAICNYLLALIQNKAKEIN